MIRDTLLYLDDISDSIKKIESFISGISEDQFSTDDKTIFAVTRALEIIGEAVNKIPEEIKEKYPEIPWKDIYGMRNVLIHAYFGVDLNVLWKTLHTDIPQLKKTVEIIKIKEFPGEPDN